jgi:hypothetical protein
VRAGRDRLILALRERGTAQISSQGLTMTINNGDALEKMLVDLLGPPEDQGVTVKAANLK